VSRLQRRRRMPPAPAAHQAGRNGATGIQPGRARPTVNGTGGLGEGFGSEGRLDPGAHSVKIDPDGRQRGPPRWPTPAQHAHGIVAHGNGQPRAALSSDTHCEGCQPFPGGLIETAGHAYKRSNRHCGTAQAIAIAERKRQLSCTAGPAFKSPRLNRCTWDRTNVIFRYSAGRT
jgi:hypothetical protein